MSIKRTIAILVTAVHAGALCASAAVKVEPDVWQEDTSRIVDIDEIVVVAQPKEYNRLRQQPTSASSFAANDIDVLRVGSAIDLSAHTPSFVMPDYGSRLTSSTYVRGIGSRTGSPAVGLYIDGIPIVSKSALNFHLYQIERIDVLRGPQGTLYGQNAEGGLIRMYSLDPMTHHGTDLRMSIGTKMQRNAEVAHYRALGERMALGVAAFYNGSNGFLRNSTTNQRADDTNEVGAKMRLAYNVTDRFSLDFIADYQYVRQNGFAYGRFDTATGNVDAPASNRTSNYTRNMLMTGVQLRYRVDAFDMNSTTSYQYVNDRMLMDQDYMPIDYMHLTQRQSHNSLTQEITLKSKHSSRWRRTYGAFFSYTWLKTSAPVYFGEGITQPIADNITNAMYTAIVGAMAGQMVAAGTPQSVAMATAERIVNERGGVTADVDMSVPGVFHTPNLNVAFFHESGINLSDRICATIGLRYDLSHTKIEYDTRASMTIAANVMGAEATHALSSHLKNHTSDNFTQVLPKLSISYQLDDKNSNAYASISKGYRAGGYNLQMFSDILQSELNAHSSDAMMGDYDVQHSDEDYTNIDETISYKPETSWNYEIGAHLNLPQQAISIDMAAYYMMVKNQQLSVMAGNYGYGRMMVNAGESYSCGIEATIRGKALNNHLAWSVNYGLTHSAFKEYKDSVKVDDKNVAQDYKGMHVPYIPKHTFGARMTYTFDISKGKFETLTISANVKAQGKTYWDVENSYAQPFYAVVGAHIEAKIGITTLTLWGKNITNTKYNTFAISSSATGTRECFAQRAWPIQTGIDIKVQL